jgi:tRNA threonylcarbamoyladenosine modification (KEOPS) complex  Pcc1 subunit
MRVEISIKYRSGKEAEAVAKALFPDNFKVPSGLVVKTFREKSVVVTVIECKRELKTLISTIDDLLRSIQVAEQVFSTKRT